MQPIRDAGFTPGIRTPCCNKRGRQKQWLVQAFITRLGRPLTLVICLATERHDDQHQGLTPDDGYKGVGDLASRPLYLRVANLWMLH